MPMVLVPIERITHTHPSIQEDKVRRIMKSIDDGCIDYLPPIECELRNGRYYIKDGSHRFEALKRLGYTEVWVYYE
ncbi:MAG: ParB N-terminal domain-containing protein [Candidatus Aenigmatarchaeota archaeon]